MIECQDLDGVHFLVSDLGVVANQLERGRWMRDNGVGAVTTWLDDLVIMDDMHGTQSPCRRPQSEVKHA